MAAYDLLVNKRHRVEPQTMWEASPGVVKNGEKWNCSGEETYSPPWAPQLEVAGHRGGLGAGSARQGEVWKTLLGTTVGASQACHPTLDHQQRKGALEHSNQEKEQERTLLWSNQESKGSLDSKRTHEPWAWRSQMERLKEADGEEREELRREGPRKSILKDQRSKWEVSKVPRQKRVKLLTPADKQTAL